MQFKQQELDRLNHYGWINKDAGIARIPIDRAMDILARTGLRDPGELRKRAPSGLLGIEEGRPAGRRPRTEAKSRP